MLRGTDKKIRSASAAYRPGILRIGRLLGVAVALSSPPGRPGAVDGMRGSVTIASFAAGAGVNVQKSGAAPPLGAAGAPKLNPPDGAAPAAAGAPNENPGVVGAVPGVGVVLAGCAPNENPPCVAAPGGAADPNEKPLAEADAPPWLLAAGVLVDGAPNEKGAGALVALADVAGAAGAELPKLKDGALGAVAGFDSVVAGAPNEKGDAVAGLEASGCAGWDAPAADGAPKLKGLAAASALGCGVAAVGGAPKLNPAFGASPG